MTWLHWALLSALFAGITAILAKVGVKDLNPDLANAIRTTVILVCAWALALSRSIQPVRSIDSKAWLFLCLSGLATGASWFCYFRALQIGDVSLVAPIDKLSIVFAMVFAAILLHEHISWQHWLGGAIIVAGAIVIALSPA